MNYKEINCSDPSETNRIDQNRISARDILMFLDYDLSDGNIRITRNKKQIIRYMINRNPNVDIEISDPADQDEVVVIKYVSEQIGYNPKIADVMNLMSVPIKELEELYEDQEDFWTQETSRLIKNILENSDEYDSDYYTYEGIQEKSDNIKAYESSYSEDMIKDIRDIKYYMDLHFGGKAIAYDIEPNHENMETVGQKYKIIIYEDKINLDLIKNKIVKGLEKRNKRKYIEVEHQ